MKTTKNLFSLLFEMEATEHDCYFEYNGVSITNPLYDEALIEEVNPIEYYGQSNIEHFISEYLNSTYVSDKWNSYSVDSFFQ
jgi:hypothetical protein